MDEHADSGDGVHVALRALVGAVGPGVLHDGDHFRAAVDDFVDEDALTAGELNLLIDCVRLGAIAHLLDQVDNHAVRSLAVAMAARSLARNRGTRELDGATWAVSVLGYAAGRLEEDDVPPRPTATEASDAVGFPGDGDGGRPAVTPLVSPDRPVGPAADQPVPRTTTVKVPSAALVPPEDEPAPAEAAPGPRHWRPALAAAAAVALLVGGAAAATMLGSEDPSDGAGAATPSTPTSGTDGAGTPASTPGGSPEAELTIQPTLADGLLAERSYRIESGRVSSSVRLTNTTDAPVRRFWVEAVPKQITSKLAGVTFKPAYEGVILRDPIVYWKVRLKPGASRLYGWSAAAEVPARATTSDLLVRLTKAASAGADHLADHGPLIARRLDVLEGDGSGGETVVVEPEPEVVVTPPGPDPTTRPTLMPSQEPTSPGPAGPTRTSQPPAPNTPSSIDLTTPRTSTELTSGAATIGVSDRDGVRSVDVTGGPPGVTSEGAAVRWAFGPGALSVTTNESTIQRRSFTVTVTVTDDRGDVTRESATWTLADTALVMPDYIGKYGDGSRGEPNIGRTFRQSFSSCYAASGPYSVVVRQSVPSGRPVKWGAAVHFVYREDDSSRPAC